MRPEQDRVASRQEVFEWYRGGRRFKNEWGQVITPDCPEWTREFGYWKKREIKLGIEQLSGMRGPFNRDMQAVWLKRCAILRRGLLNGDFYRPTGDTPEQVKKQHRRIIQIHRSARFGAASQRDAMSRYPFYVEPNCNFIPEDDVEIAEKNGVAFHRSIIDINYTNFHRIDRRLQVSGSVKGFWSSKFNLDDHDVKMKDYQKYRSVFMFSNPEDAKLVDEELVWLTLKY